MNTRKFLCLLSLVFGLCSLVSSFGQTAKTRSALYTDADTALADSGETEITPADIRTLLKNAIASSYNPLSDGTGVSTTTLNGYFADPSTNASFSASAWRSDLGLVIGTNVQAYDADLTTWAGITPSANVQTLMGAADYAAFRSSLGLVIGTNVQAYDADLDDLADGSLTGTKVAFADTDGLFTSTNLQAAIEELNDSINAGAANGTGAKVHWSQLLGVPAGFADGTDDGSGGGTDDQTAAEVPFTPAGSLAATQVQAALEELDTEKQAADADLTDLADGSLTGTKVAFADTDSNFTATDLQAAVEELDDINGSGPNAADGKVSWTQLVGVPAGFADGSDDGSGGSSGTLNTIKAAGSAVGGSDIVTLDFSSEFDVTETPDTEINLAIGSAIARDSEVTAAVGALSTVYQPLDSDLTSIAALTTTSFGRGLLDDADAAAGRTSLGVAIGADVQAYDADLTTWAGITPSANVQTLLGAADYAAFRSSLGLVIGTNVQAYDADLDDLADGSLSGTMVGTGIDADNITTGALPNARLDADLQIFAGITPSANVQTLLGAADYAAFRSSLGLVIGTNVQAYDADLDDLADGSLTGTKVAFADTDGLFTAANVQAALEELNDSINAGAANGTGAKVHWSQLLGVPAGFADGTDDGSGGGSVDDTAYDATSWNGVTTTAPSKNAVRDIIETISSAGVSDGDKGDLVVSSSGTVWTVESATMINTGLKLLDTNASHTLTIAPGSNITANRTLTVTTGDANRNLTMTSDVTLSQNLTSSSNVNFNTLGLGSPTDGSIGIFNIPSITATGGGTVHGYYGGGTMSALSNGDSFYGVYLNYTFSTGVRTGLTTYGARIATGTKSGTGTIDNNYGLYVQAQTIGTNNYAIYTNAGLVRLGDDVTMTDDLAVGGALTVTGAVSASNLSGTNTGDQSLAGSNTGTHASPSTTNPLSPTWTATMHTVWYGATGGINLPAASGYAGRGILIYNTGAFTITVDPDGSEVIVRDGTVQTGGVSITLSSGAGNYVALLCDGARWVTLGYKGTLAVGS